MNGWLLYSKKDALENMDYIDWFIDEATKQQIHLTLIYREDVTIGMIDGHDTILLDQRETNLPDFIVIRTIEPILQAIFERNNIMTFNSLKVSTICNHKAWTHIQLQALGIPMPTTIFITKKDIPAQPPLPFPFVIKEATGRSGKQVYYVKDEQAWHRTLSSIESNDLLCQCADVKLGRDVRVFVIGKEIIAAVLRYNDHDFRANYKLGGQAKLYHLSKKEEEMIQTIVNQFDFGLVGIDFLISHRNELLFNEIEDVVGSRILSKVSDINLLEKYITHIKNNVPST